MLIRRRNFDQCRIHPAETAVRAKSAQKLSKPDPGSADPFHCGAWFATSLRRRSYRMNISRNPAISPLSTLPLPFSKIGRGAQQNETDQKNSIGKQVQLRATQIEAKPDEKPGQRGVSARAVNAPLTK